MYQLRSTRSTGGSEDAEEGMEMEMEETSKEKEKTPGLLFLFVVLNMRLSNYQLSAFRHWLIRAVNH